MADEPKGLDDFKELAADLFAGAAEGRKDKCLTVLFSLAVAALTASPALGLVVNAATGKLLERALASTPDARLAAAIKEEDLQAQRIAQADKIVAAIAEILDEQQLQQIRTLFNLKDELLRAIQNLERRLTPDAAQCAGERGGGAGYPARRLPPRLPFVAGRDQELEDLSQALAPQAKFGAVTRVALSAFGGVGKSTLAKEFVWAHLHEYPGGAFWLSGSASPLSELASIGIELSTGDDDVAVRARKVAVRLEQGEPALLILDNVDSVVRMNDWHRVLPGGACSVLISTRLRQLPDVQMIKVGGLKDHDALQLLAHFRADAGEDANKPFVHRVAQLCNGWPIALTAIGVYLAIEPGLTWATYADDLERRLADVYQETAEGSQDSLAYSPFLDPIFEDLFRVCREHERLVLQVASVLPSESLIVQWVALVASSVGGVVAKDRDAEPGGLKSVSRLLREGLLTGKDGPFDVVAIHNLLGAWLMARCDQATLTAILAGFANLSLHIRMVLATSGNRPSPPAMVLAASGLVEFLCGRHWTEAARLALAISDSMERIGRRADAVRMNATLLREAPNTEEVEELKSDVLFNLSVLQLHDGQTIESLENVRQAKAIRTKCGFPSTLGRIRYDVFEGLVLKAVGDLPLSRNVLIAAVKELEAGRDNESELAQAYDHLGGVLIQLQLFEDALDVLQKAKSIDDRVGATQQQLVQRLSNTGLALLHLGRLDAAEDCFSRARAMPGGSDTSKWSTLENLGLVELARHNFAAARERILLSLQERERQGHVEDHTFSASYANLAGALSGEQKFREALTALDRADRLRRTPDEHPTVAKRQLFRGDLLHRLGDSVGACREWQDAHRKLIGIFGPNDPNVKILASNLRRYCTTSIPGNSCE